MVHTLNVTMVIAMPKTVQTKNASNEQTLIVKSPTRFILWKNAIFDIFEYCRKTDCIGKSTINSRSSDMMNTAKKEA